MTDAEVLKKVLDFVVFLQQKSNPNLAVAFFV